MAYSDPTNFVSGTDGVHYDTNVGKANLQHVIVTDDLGNTYDYLLVEGEGIEFYQIASDGTLTLTQTITTDGIEQNKFDDFTVIEDNDSNAVYLFDSGRDATYQLKWDPATASWTEQTQPNADFFAAGTVKIDAYQADDGTIYGYAGSTSGSGGAGSDTLNQYTFNESTLLWEFDRTYDLSADLGKSLGSGFENGMETGRLEVLHTKDGPKLLQINSTGNERAEGFTLYDIDPVTGDLVPGSASSFNFATTADVTNFGVDAEFTLDNFADELISTDSWEYVVDGNGNIVIFGGTTAASAGDSYGMIVIDPTLTVPDSEDFVTGDGDGDVDNSAAIVVAHTEVGTVSTENGTVSSVAWTANPAISYSPDGQYMYISGDNTTGIGESIDTHTIVVDTSDYSIVTWGKDTTSGYSSTDLSNDGATTDNEGAASNIIVQLSTGETYYIDQNNDTSNATTGWLSVSEVDASLTTTPTAPICFAIGTLIETEKGPVRVEDLAVGDLVKTLEHGNQPIRWIGKSVRDAIGNLAPILIRKGALGNTRDLRVSPQHRMLISDWRAELLFGEDSVLVAAKHLVNDHNILREVGGKVVYYHILFDQHELIWSEGILCESFHPGSEAMKAISSDQAQEIYDLFPELETDFDAFGRAASLSLKSREARALTGFEVAYAAANEIRH